MPFELIRNGCEREKVAGPPNGLTHFIARNLEKLLLQSGNRCVVAHAEFIGLPFQR